MINILRGKVPKSLSRPKIKKYLDDLANYNQLSDDDRKLSKKPDAGSYKNSDVFDAFDRDFFSKCYLTEKKYVNSWSLDIEHFKAKNFGQFPELKYDWNNLYPCNHDANMYKPRIEPNGGYLDPCESNDDVEVDIIYSLNIGGEMGFIASDVNNKKAVNSSKLLYKIHNGIDYNSKQKTAHLRYLIDKKANKTIELIKKWKNDQSSLNSAELIILENKIKNLLSRKSDFTMLLRSLSSVKYLPKNFLD